MKVGIRAPEQCLLCQSLAVMPGKSSEAGPAPIDINGSRVVLLGLTGNSKTDWQSTSKTLDKCCL